MATLQERNGSYRVLFLWHGKRCAFTIGKVSQEEANAKASQAEYLLMRLKQGLVQLPSDCEIAEFLRFDGKLPAARTAPLGAATPTNLSLAELRDRYLAANQQSLEQSSLSSIETHFRHLVSTYGDKYPVQQFSLAELQRHVERRSKVKHGKQKIAATTIKKEIVSLRTAWNWAVRMEFLAGKLPMSGLRYPKTDEKPAFMTRAEIERRIQAGGNAKTLWDALFLTAEEVSELLQFVKQHSKQPFLYPMVCFAAHTGARRSELIRAEVSDVDLTAGVVIVHERKRVHGKRTTRRVPISPLLQQVLTDWMAAHPGGMQLFAQRGDLARSKKKRDEAAAITHDEAHDHFRRVLKGSKWQVLKGWHVLRHSFISACVMKGVDQRLIDTWVGHSTEEQRQRYRHLYPSVEQAAIRSVFQ